MSAFLSRRRRTALLKAGLAIFAGVAWTVRFLSGRGKHRHDQATSLADMFDGPAPVADFHRVPTKRRESLAREADALRIGFAMEMNCVTEYGHFVDHQHDLDLLQATQPSAPQIAPPGGWVSLVEAAAGM